MELPKWTRCLHSGFPELFKIQIAATVLSLHLSGSLAGGTAELTVLLASAIDAKCRGLEDSLGNQYHTPTKILSVDKPKYSFQKTRKYRGWSKKRSLK